MSDERCPECGLPPLDESPFCANEIHARDEGPATVSELLLERIERMERRADTRANCLYLVLCLVAMCLAFGLDAVDVRLDRLEQTQAHVNRVVDAYLGQLENDE